MKRKLLALLLALMMLATMTACDSQKDDEPKKDNALKKDREIVEAVEMLEEKWAEIYEDELYDDDEGYFEIKNTRKIRIKDTFTVDENLLDCAEEMFGDVDYILEFVLYTDYYSSSYAFQPYIYDKVVVYEDGSMETCTDLLRNYGNRTYNYDYSGIIEEIEDYGDLYNCKKQLKEKESSFLD